MIRRTQTVCSALYSVQAIQIAALETLGYNPDARSLQDTTLQGNPMSRGGFAVEEGLHGHHLCLRALWRLCFILTTRHKSQSP